MLLLKDLLIRTYALQFVVAQFIAFSPACGGVRGGTGDKSPPFRESETYYQPKPDCSFSIHRASGCDDKLSNDEALSVQLRKFY